MWYGSGFSFKGIAGALLLSCFIAGVVTALTSPVTAKNAAPTVSVNRIIKGDRLPPVPATKPKQHDFNSGRNAGSKADIGRLRASLQPLRRTLAGAYSLALSDLMRTTRPTQA